MSAPKLFFGGSATGQILQAGVGYQDAGAAVSLRAETDAIAPAGAGGDCLFHSIYLPFTQSMPAAVRITPVLDGVELTAEAVEFALPVGDMTSEVREVGLSIGYERAGQERGRYAMRGTWFGLIVEVDELLDGRLILEEVEVEFDVVSESKSPVAEGNGAA